MSKTSTRDSRCDQSSTIDGRFYSSTVALLSNPSAYLERTRQVECIETHISAVFLADNYVYKLKKPIIYDFLDYSTPLLRKSACEEEVRLNRRLAPHVYMGIVPITLQLDGQLKLDGDGTPVEWVVKMRRLAERRSLERLIYDRRLTPGMVTRIASRLSRFYQELPSLDMDPPIIGGESATISHRTGNIAGVFDIVDERDR